MRLPYAPVATIGHRKHHAHKRHAIGNGVMDPKDDRSAALVILDNVQLPQRPRFIQMFGSKLGDVALKLPLVCVAWKPDAFDVPGFVEIGVIHPPMFARTALDALLEPRDREEAPRKSSRRN